MTVTLGLITWLALAPDADAPKKPDLRYAITTKKKDDRVEAHTEKARTVFTVTSRSGIGRAAIVRRDEKWPEAVVVRLRLKGMERFEAGNGTLTLQAAAGIRDGKLEVRRWKGGEEDPPLDEKSPLWLDVRVLDGDGKPATKIPLASGTFEIHLPKAFFKENPRSVTLSWIDFYRH